MHEQRLLHASCSMQEIWCMIVIFYRSTLEVKCESNINASYATVNSQNHLSCLSFDKFKTHTGI